MSARFTTSIFSLLQLDPTDSPRNYLRSASWSPESALFESNGLSSSRVLATLFWTHSAAVKHGTRNTSGSPTNRELDEAIVTIQVPQAQFCECGQRQHELFHDHIKKLSARWLKPHRLFLFLIPTANPHHSCKLVIFRTSDILFC